jgi:phage gp29-like protein
MLQLFKRQAAPPAAITPGAALTREVAGVQSDLWAQSEAYLGVRPNRDPLLAARQPDAAYAYPYGLFEEALDKDAHLTALIAQRKAAVLGWQRHVEPADSSPEAALVAEVVRFALDNIGNSAGKAGYSAPGTPPGMDPALPPEAVAADTALRPMVDGGIERDLCELLDAIPYGLAVSEVIWGEYAGGRLIDAGGIEDQARHASVALPPSAVSSRLLLPVALRSRHPRRFTFSTEGELRLLTPEAPVQGEALPPRKFLVFAPYGRHEDPYGLPALRSVWWLAYFKRQVLRFWVMFAEKFGAPTTVIKHPLGATEREKAAYRRIVGSIQQETGLVVPEGVDLSLLEAQRSGTVSTYSDLVRFCNEEMSKALLGQTLSTEATERGARSLGEVHLQVRQDIVRQDAQALCALITGQLVRWIVELNFPPAMRLYPQWRLSAPKQDDLALQLAIDDFFMRQGLSLDQAELYARYGRKQLTAGS